MPCQQLFALCLEGEESSKKVALVTGSSSGIGKVGRFQKLGRWSGDCSTTCPGGLPGGDQQPCASVILLRRLVRPLFGGGRYCFGGQLAASSVHSG